MDLKKYLDKGIGYNAYKEKVIQGLNDDPNQKYASYIELNLQRMSRLEKKFSFNELQLKKLDQLKNRKFHLLIISEGWCGDAAQILPIVQGMVNHLPLVEESIVFRDENPKLMDAYENNGSRAIPILIGLDPTNCSEIFHWGPRPKKGQALLKKHKDHPEEYPSEQFYKDLQKYYNQNKGLDIFDELLHYFQLVEISSP